ncbi:MAG: hypothetical protein RL680_1011 [Actinomycetota bacterium]|jgi:hypothetical protein
MYSKNGSIPKPETDGTEGWIEVPDEPACPAGKEVVWWSPPGWIIRDVRPAGNWSWSQSQEQWVEYTVQEITQIDTSTIASTDLNSLASADLNLLSSTDISSL